MTPQAVIGGAFLRVLEGLIGLGNILEFLFALGIFRHVRVIFARELAIRFLDVVFAGAAFYTQNVVVVLEFHHSLPLSFDELDLTRQAPHLESRLRYGRFNE